MKQYYSQKNYHLQHCVNGSIVSIGHQSPHTTIVKKSNMAKKLQNSITTSVNQTIKLKQNNYHFSSNEYPSNLNLCPSYPMSPMMTKPKKPTPKPIQNVPQRKFRQACVGQYKKIICNLTYYLEYYDLIFKKQLQKHDNYFNQIIKFIQAEKKRSKSQLQKHLDSLNKTIEVKRGAIQNKIRNIQDLKIKFCCDKQRQQLSTQKSLQIPLFQVNIKGLQTFKEETKKCFFQTKTFQQMQLQRQMNEQFDKQSIAQTICLEDSIKTQTKEKRDFQDLTYEQMQQMTPIHHLSKQEFTFPTKNHLALQNQDLYCDQDIENILKENKIVREKRYQCNEAAIPEESQSHQDSLVISNLETMR